METLPFIGTCMRLLQGHGHLLLQKQLTWACMVAASICASTYAQITATTVENVAATISSLYKLKSDMDIIIIWY